MHGFRKISPSTKDPNEKGIIATFHQHLGTWWVEKPNDWRWNTFFPIYFMYVHIFIYLHLHMYSHTHTCIHNIYIYIFTYGHVSMCCSLHGCVKHSDTLYLSGGAVTHAWPNQLTNSMARQSMIAGVQPATLLIIASKLIWIFQCLRVEYLQLYLHGGGARKREIQRDDVYIYIHIHTHISKYTYIYIYIYLYILYI